MLKLKPGKTREAAAKGVAAVDRALSIVAALEADPRPRTLAEVSKVTSLYKSTILRLLVSLEAAGYVARLADGRYRLGAMAYRLGLAFERADPLREHVLPVLHRLVEQGTESSSLHVRRDADTRLCLFRVDSHHSTLDRVHAGDILPLRKGAAGHVLLAFDGETGAKYDEIRRNFVAISLGERDPSCAGIASPIFGPDGSLKATVSLSGPAERFTKPKIAWMSTMVLAAARDMTQALGGSFPTRVSVSSTAETLHSARRRRSVAR